jgi:uncharacterized protein (TIRG00374 family)
METGDDILAIEEDEISSGKKAKGLFRKIFWFVLRIGLAAGIIGWLVSRNFDKFVQSLAAFNYYWLIPACLCYFLHMLVCSWRWYKLAKVLDIQITLYDAFSLTMKSYFFSLVIPGGAIGGDLAKVGFLSSRTPKGTKVEGAFTILMDRIVGMVALFSIAIIIILSTLPILMSIDLTVLGLQNKLMHVAAIAGLLGMCLFGLIAMFAIFYHQTLEKFKPIGYLMKMGDRYTNNAVSRMTAATDIYRNQLKLFLEMTVVSIFLVHLNMVLVVFFIMKGMGIGHVHLVTLTSAVIIGNIAGLIPLTVSGVGLRDVTIATILYAGGIENATTIPIIFTALILVFNIFSGLFFVFDSDKKNKRRQASDKPQ